MTRCGRTAVLDQRVERLAYTVEEAAIALGIGRDLIYDDSDWAPAT
jgi:hypothetical protein